MSEALAVQAAHGRYVELMAERFVCRLVDRGCGVVWVHLAGELDIASAPRLERMLARSELQAPLVVLDLRKLTFMDSFGAHVVAHAATRARGKGNRLVLIRAPRHVQRLLTLTGAAARIEIVEPGDSEPAIQALLHLARTELEHAWA
ncbi:MAG TPA: STAS domain-containing protein [Solirubrobacteraceae bacterium]|nr:STAS domain-containing protein [Solirubrobacteraceae bacterium]